MNKRLEEIYQKGGDDIGSEEESCIKKEVSFSEEEIPRKVCLEEEEIKPSTLAQGTRQHAEFPGPILLRIAPLPESVFKVPETNKSVTGIELYRK